MSEAFDDLPYCDVCNGRYWYDAYSDRGDRYTYTCMEEDCAARKAHLAAEAERVMATRLAGAMVALRRVAAWVGMEAAAQVDAEFWQEEMVGASRGACRTLGRRLRVADAIERGRLCLSWPEEE